METKTIPTAKRTELMKLLDDLSAQRLIYIHAPAGYGKTVSSLLWLEHAETTMGAKHARLVLDEFDNKQSDFCRRFAASLLSLQPDNKALREYAAHPAFDTAPAEFTLRALNAFEADSQKNILVLDDLHLIDNDAILKLLPVIINRLPKSVVILLLSRAAPPDSFSDLLAKSSMAMVSADHLSFTSREIKSFFNANGHHLTNEQAADVYESTGGWAISLRALLLSGMDAGNVTTTFKHLETFLKTYVWVKWDERLRRFMTRTSVAEELTPDLCDALTGEASGAETLDRLTRENAFIRVTGTGSYRFHNLFREFLLNMLEAEGEEVKNEQMQKAGDWFFANEEYYKATFYYVKCKNYAGIARGYSAMNRYSTKNNNMEARISMIDFMELESIPQSAFDENPVLYVALIFGCYLGGNADKMEKAIDLSKIAMPNIKKNYPALLETLAFIHGLDPRQSLFEHTKQLLNAENSKRNGGKASTTTLSQNLPYYHRSQRDYSEYVHNLDEGLDIMRRTFGVIIGNEFDVLEDCIRAGLLYEQGKLDLAHEASLSAAAKIPDGCAVELRFCAMMILSATLMAKGQESDAKKLHDRIRDMIEEDKAYFLYPNFHAYQFRLKLYNGDKEAALKWLGDYGDNPFGKMSFYKIYTHFTTARAYICAGDYNNAIVFLKKLIVLSEQYNRPLDIIEANILIAAAYWKSGGRMHGEALASLEGAILLAREYGYTQLFANEGADLTSMLHRLQKRVVQQDYSGELTVSHVKTLYIIALEHAKISKGLTGGRPTKELKFTEKQKTVIRYLCEGLTHMEIGERMGLKRSAVKSHMIIIYEKLDVSNGLDAIMKIRELGIGAEE